MAISLNIQTASSGALKNLGKSLKGFSASIGRLASGTRINKAVDDAAGLAISEQLAASLRTTSRAELNVREASSVLFQTDGAIAQVQSISGRLQELALQSSNGVYSDDERAALQQEFSSLTQEIQRISETTQYNGQNLLDGSEISVQIGTDGGENSTQQVGGVNVKALASQLSSANIGTQDGAQAAIDTVRQFSADLATERASRVGASYTRLESVGQTLGSRMGAESGALAAIRDVDVAQETAQLSRNQILSQASVSVLAQANRVNTMVINLLLG